MQQLLERWGLNLQLAPPVSAAPSLYALILVYGKQQQSCIPIVLHISLRSMKGIDSTVFLLAQHIHTDTAVLCAHNNTSGHA